MNKVDDFMKAWTLIDYETGKINRFLVMVMFGAVMYGLGIYIGIYYQNARITDSINQTEVRILEKQGIKQFSPDTKEPLSI